VSFLIDPPWLYANGQAYARLAPASAQGNAARGIGVATVATFWIVSVSLYLNQRWADPIAKACGAEDGRDWMLNSGVFHIDHRRAGWRVHTASAALFATYPVWLSLGERTARARAPSRGSGGAAFSPTLNGSRGAARVGEPAGAP
jgi:hypothetical protein